MTQWVVTANASTNGQRRIHLDEDCVALESANSYRPAMDSDRAQFDVCKLCNGTQAPSIGDYSYQRALKEAARDD